MTDPVSEITTPPASHAPSPSYSRALIHWWQRQSHVTHLFLVWLVVILVAGMPLAVSQVAQGTGLFSFASEGSGEQVACDLIVDGNGDGDFTTIQEGINALQEGQALCVRGGSYPEKVSIIGRTNLTIQSFPGELAVVDGGDHQLPNPTCKRKDKKSSSGPGGRSFGRDGCSVNPLVNIDRSSYISVINFEIKGSSGRGLVVNRSQDILLKGIDSHSNWNMGIVVTSINLENPTQRTARVTIEDSKMWDNIRARPVRNLIGGSGGVFASGVKDSVMRNSLVYNNFGEGFDVGRHAENILITGNTFWDNSHTSFYINDGINVTFDGNFIFCSDDRMDWHKRNNIKGKNSYGVGMTLRNENHAEKAQNRNPGYGNALTNNIVVGCSNNVVISSQKKKLVKDSIVAHNTLVNARGPEGKKDKQVANMKISGGKYQNMVIANNLIVQQNTQYPALSMPNGWYKKLPNNSFTFAGNLMTAHSKWKTREGFEAIEGLELTTQFNGIMADTADPRDFILPDTSPAIDSATVLDVLAHLVADFFGSLRDSLPDVGAYEWALPPIPTPEVTPTLEATPSATPTQEATPSATPTQEASPSATPEPSPTDNPPATNSSSLF